MTSGTLYSVFKEPRPRALEAPGPRRTAGARPKEHPPCGGPSSLANLVGLRQSKPAQHDPLEADGCRRTETLGKNQPLRGTGI